MDTDTDAAAATSTAAEIINGEYLDANDRDSTMSRAVALHRGPLPADFYLVGQEDFLSTLTPDEIRTAAAVKHRLLSESASREITPFQQSWLDWRLLTHSDQAALHHAGRKRTRGDLTASCRCARAQPGWSDVKHATLYRWREESPAFNYMYNFIIKAPALLAGIMVENLELPALSLINQALLDETGTFKGSDKLRAAEVVLKMTGKLQQVGVNKKQERPTEQGANRTWADQVAASRVARGLLPAGEQPGVDQDGANSTAYNGSTDDEQYLPERSQVLDVHIAHAPFTVEFDEDIPLPTIVFKGEMTPPSPASASMPNFAGARYVAERQRSVDMWGVEVPEPPEG